MRNIPTERELQVLDLLANGASTAEVSTKLGITKRTVEDHIKNASIKLGARNRTHAIALAVYAGLVRPERAS
jgi:DNA-binding CsgD family transcriptional regulator